LLGLALRLFSLVCSTNGAALLFCTGCAVSVAAVDTCEATSQAALVSQPGGRGPSPTVSATCPGGRGPSPTVSATCGAPPRRALYFCMVLCPPASPHPAISPVCACTKLPAQFTVQFDSFHSPPAGNTVTLPRLDSIITNSLVAAWRIRHFLPAPSSPMTKTCLSQKLVSVAVRGQFRSDGESALDRIPCHEAIYPGHPLRGYLSQPPSQRLSIPATNHGPMAGTGLRGSVSV